MSQSVDEPVRDAHAQKKRKSNQKPSWIATNLWGEKIIDVDGVLKWKCLFKYSDEKICGKLITGGVAASTGNTIKHLRLAHHVTANSPVQGQVTITTGIDKYLAKSALPTKFTKEAFYRCLVEDIVASRAPYTAVERPTLQRLLYLVQTANSLTEVKLPSDSTIKRNITEYFYELKQQVKDQLSALPCVVHTANGWTTSNMKHSFLGITAHWVDQDWRSRSLTIGFEPLKGSHSGKNLADTMVKVLEEFGVENKPFFLTTDNASNMGAMARELQASLGENVFSATNNYVPCIGHVINLVTQAALAGGLNAQAIDESSDIGSSGNEDGTEQMLHDSNCKFIYQYWNVVVLLTLLF